MQGLRKRSNGGKTQRGKDEINSDLSMLPEHGDEAEQEQAPTEKNHPSPPYFIIKVDKFCNFLIVLALAIMMLTLVSSSPVTTYGFDGMHEVSQVGVVRETQQRINFGQRPSESTSIDVTVTIPSFIKKMPLQEEEGESIFDRSNSSLLNSPYEDFSPHIEGPESDGAKRHQWTADFGGHVYSKDDFEDDFLEDADEYLIEFFAFDDDLVREQRRDCRRTSFYRNHKPTCNKLHEATIFDPEYSSRYLASGAYRAAFSISDGDVVLKTPAFHLDYE